MMKFSRTLRASYCYSMYLSYRTLSIMWAQSGQGITSLILHTSLIARLFGESHASLMCRTFIIYKCGQASIAHTHTIHYTMCAILRSHYTASDTGSCIAVIYVVYTHHRENIHIPATCKALHVHVYMNILKYI